MFLTHYILYPTMNQQRQELQSLNIFLKIYWFKQNKQERSNNHLTNLLQSSTFQTIQWHTPKRNTFQKVYTETLKLWGNFLYIGKVKLYEKSSTREIARPIKIGSWSQKSSYHCNFLHCPLSKISFKSQDTIWNTKKQVIILPNVLAF